MGCAVIIVTHNSQKWLPKALESIEKQSTPPDEVIIVDNASTEPTYLEQLPFNVISLKENRGYAGGNNEGLVSLSHSSEYILFLNPDCVLGSTFLEKARDYFVKNPSVGALGGTLLRFEGGYDSTGIFSRWYGGWYDRTHEAKEEEIDAVCGAALVVRRHALSTVLLQGRWGFDPEFFMYKEDIDLCQRLIRTGWKVMHVPDLIAYHGRGWKKRREMPKEARLYSAKNEGIVNRRRKHFIGIFYSFIKYWMVKKLGL